MGAKAYFLLSFSHIMEILSPLWSSKQETNLSFCYDSSSFRCLVTRGLLILVELRDFWVCSEHWGIERDLDIEGCSAMFKMLWGASPPNNRGHQEPFVFGEGFLSTFTCHCFGGGKTRWVLITVAFFEIQDPRGCWESRSQMAILTWVHSHCSACYSIKATKNAQADQTNMLGQSKLGLVAGSSFAL